MSDSMCNHKGCDKKNFVKGFCATHATEHGHGELLQKRYDAQKLRVAAKKIQPAATAVKAVAVARVDKPTEKAPQLQAKEVVASDASALVMSDMGLELDRMFREKRAEWLFDLANATTIRSSAKMFLAMADTLDRLVY